MTRVNWVSGTSIPGLVIAFALQLFLLRGRGIGRAFIDPADSARSESNRTRRNGKESIGIGAVTYSIRNGGRCPRENRNISSSVSTVKICLRFIFTPRRVYLGSVYIYRSERNPI